MRRWIALTSSLVLVVAACGDTTATTTAPSTPSATTEPQTASTVAAIESPRDVSFVSGGNTLEATLWPGGTTWVVLGHMLPTDKSSWNAFAALLQEAGYSVVAYNNRGFGASEGAREPFALYQDAAAALSYAQENGATHLVYGGASMNGATAVKLGVFYEFSAILVLSGVRSFPSVTDAVSAMFEVDEPTLFVAAEDDRPAVADLDEFLARSQTADYIVIPEGGHGTDMLAANPDLAAQILEWLVAEIP
jgi:pimeloyl-ACP methyl ester carboxylesterase